jgi:mRNA-degrading endonuclease toxin of MazEF toxin-antitoxin module
VWPIEPSTDGVCAITGHNIPGTEVPIDPSHETGSGLTKPCVVSCPNIMTMDQALVIRIIGYLSDATMREVQNCLRKVLKLP